jgi:hypothetical protein
MANNIWNSRTEGMGLAGFLFTAHINYTSEAHQWEQKKQHLAVR